MIQTYLKNGLYLTSSSAYEVRCDGDNSRVFKNRDLIHVGASKFVYLHDTAANGRFLVGHPQYSYVQKNDNSKHERVLMWSNNDPMREGADFSKSGEIIEHVPTVTIQELKKYLITLHDNLKTHDNAKMKRVDGKNKYIATCFRVLKPDYCSVPVFEEADSVPQCESYKKFGREQYEALSSIIVAMEKSPQVKIDGLNLNMFDYCYVNNPKFAQYLSSAACDHFGLIEKMKLMEKTTKINDLNF